MTVIDVLEYLASGMTYDKIPTEFPDLTYEDIKADRDKFFSREREADKQILIDKILTHKLTPLFAASGKAPC